MEKNKIRITNLVENKESINHDIMKRCVVAVLEQLQFKTPIFVDVSIVTNEEIREINLEHREKDSVTDVLSFPMQDFFQGEAEFDIKGEIDPVEHTLFIGDIVLCYDRAKEQAIEYGHTLERELGFLVVHSMLHLFGFDHEDEDQRIIMRHNEEAVLTAVGLERLC